MSANITFGTDNQPFMFHIKGLTILGRSHCGLRTGLLGLQKEPKWGHLRDLHSALKLLLWGTPTVQKDTSMLLLVMNDPVALDLSSIGGGRRGVDQWREHRSPTSALSLVMRRSIAEAQVSCTGVLPEAEEEPDGDLRGARPEDVQIMAVKSDNICTEERERVVSLWRRYKWGESEDEVRDDEDEDA
ncbi:hypothetical protein BHE74_00046798 [Ensete ventricosum]|nr:hypothetical protein BHE74_00046798 [Ensete ventricosum]